jgi:hypothetical protein
LFSFAQAGLKCLGTKTRIAPESELIFMRGNTIYLEAPTRTQDLLNIKWTLHSAGYSVASTWHDGNGCPTLGQHWDRSSLEKLQVCDSLVVVSGNREATPELAMMAGFALARGIAVYWIGPRVAGLCDFGAVQQFDTAEEFRKHVLSRGPARPGSTAEFLAA